jgi:YVTN family beta-propeller protein
MKDSMQNVSRTAVGRAIRLVALTLLAAMLGAGAALAQLNAYTANIAGGSLSVVDVLTNTNVGTIPIPGGPRFLAINAAGSLAYVAAAPNTVSVVDLVTTAVITTIPVGANPSFPTFSGNEAFLYVGNNGSNSVSVIDTATNTVVATLTVGPNPQGVATTPDGASVWVAIATGEIVVIDTATNTITTSFPVAFFNQLLGIAFTPDGAFAYVSNASAGNCLVVDTATHAIIATIPTGAGPFDSAITPDGSTVYQANQSGSVSVIDTATNTVVATVPPGGAATGIDVTPDGSFAYVSIASANQVAVIDTATNTVVATVPVGAVPIGLAIARVIEVPPTLSSDNASVAANEGQTATNTGTVKDINRDTVTLTASVGTVVNNGDGTWSWSFGTTDGPTQSQTVTISGDDGHGGTASTSFSLVVNNVAPTIVSVSNNGPVVAGSPATITVAATDPAGANDPLAYSFDCDNNGTFEIGPQAGNSASCTFATVGSHVVNVRVTDGDGGTATGSTTVTVILPPPSCAGATASPSLLWPPNHKFVAITISGVVNPAPGAVTISVTSIFQDEPVQSPGSGNTSPDATGVGTSTPSVRSERDGDRDGRVYHINFTATGASGSCTGSVTVGVPHDQGHGGPVDQGALYNSTLP